MLTWFRKLLENWIARVFFGLLVVVFVFWGISNVLTLAGNDTTVAHVAGKPVDLPAVQAAYQDALNEAERKGAVDAAQRQDIARQALGTVLQRQGLEAFEQQLGIVVPDSAVRAEIDSMSQFQTAGVFDPQKFNQLLLQNNLSPDRYIAEVNYNLGNQQLIEAMTGGEAPPAALTAQIFAFVAQARDVDMVAINTGSQALPPPPSDAALRRFWKNHPAKYSAPEYRTIKLVVLSPAVLAAGEPVSQDELQAAYQQVAATQNQPATRSVRVVTISDAAKAAKLAADWKSGSGWAQIQKEAAADGAPAVELDHQKQNQFPSQILGDAIFAAQPDTVTGPVQGTFGYFVFEVTDAVAAGAPPFAAVQAQLKQQIQLQKAQRDVAQDVDNVQDALAGQTPLDKLPGNLGLAAVQGTLDANGNALDGTPAPIPGGAAMRAAVVKAVFAAHVGDPPQLVTGPDGGYFAFTIDSITPPALKPYEQVAAQVAADWRTDYFNHEAETQAAALMQAVNAGQTFDKLAAAANLPVTQLPPISRGVQLSGIPEQLLPVLFSMKPGQATMAQTTSGFIVLTLTKIENPNESSAPDEVAGIVQTLTKSLQNDVAQSLVESLQTREHIIVDNPKLLAQLAQ